jgi:hypothetical protein
MDAKPRKVKAKVTRVVTEIAIVYLNRDGSVDEYEEYREAHERMNATRKRQHYVHSKIIPKRAYKCDVCGYYHLTRYAKPHDERDT